MLTISHIWLYFVFLVFPLAFQNAISQTQTDIEYGIGFVGPGQFKVFSKPSIHSKVLAQVQSYDIKFADRLKSESQIPYCIEIVYNDVYGFPILAYSTDSAWINISLDCRKKTNPPTGWVNVKEVSPDVILWGSYWTRGFSINFIDNNPIAFYDSMRGGLINIHHQMKQFDSSSYHMLVEVVKGNWMKVTVESPEPPSDMDEKDVISELGIHYFRTQVWIRFLDDNGRPRVFSASAD